MYQVKFASEAILRFGFSKLGAISGQ